MLYFRVKFISFSAVVIFLTLNLSALKSNTEIAKSGWSFGAVPIAAFNADTGFQYGALVNFFDYANGLRYPVYDHSLYFEVSRTTRGTGIYQMRYDNRALDPKIRLRALAGYFSEETFQFFGFNGNASKYNPDFENDQSRHYLSRAYYRYAQASLRLSTDVTFLIKPPLRISSGFGHYQVACSSVNTDKLNEGKEKTQQLPDVRDVPGLYEKYISWGLISKREKKGGAVTFFKTGFILDTRDNEPNPMKGLWSEVLLTGSQAWQSGPWLTLSLLHRQYFTIVPKRMNFALRLGWQQKIAGAMPWYMLDTLFNAGKHPNTGLGGYEQLRGIEKRRILSEGMMWANFELRWKFFKTVIKKKNNFYIALSLFNDWGMSVKSRNLPAGFTASTEAQKYFLHGSKETPHGSAGAGLHSAFNENFIVTLNYALAFSDRDGKDGLYIDLNFLF